MEITFYISAAIAIIATLRVITCTNAIHALLYMIISLLAAGVIFFTFGAPFAAAIVVIVNAGAIMVLFVFVIMMLNLGPQATEQEKIWLPRRIWLGPTILALILAAELLYSFLSRGVRNVRPAWRSRQKKSASLCSAHICSRLNWRRCCFLPGLLGAYHLGRGAMQKEDKNL